MHQLRVQTSASAVERIEALLFSCGAVSISFLDAENQAILEPSIGDHPLWTSLFVQAHFQSEDQINLASKALLHEDQLDSEITLEKILDHGWQEKFQQQFSPMQFGSLWIFPSWEKDPAPDGISLRLDPGLAFGTGQHETTHLCLEWLSQADLNHREVIDFGCGSGILALAAIALGASHVHAIDIDPQAVMATNKNIKKNNFQENRFTTGNIDVLNQIQADILVANILAEPLIGLRDQLKRHLKSGGQLVLSGILEDQVKSITQHYSETFTHKQTTLKGEWASIVFCAH